MMPFLNELLNPCIDYGSAFGEAYSVDIVVDAADNTYTRLRHPYPVARYEVGFGNKDYEFTINYVLDLFHRCGGMFGGLRLRDRIDYSTNGYEGTPQASDGPAATLDEISGTYQIVRWYGDPSDPLATRRRVTKPVSGSVVVGIRADNGTTYPITDFSVNENTGVITLGPNKNRSIQSMILGATTAIQIGTLHGFVTGDSVVISDVVGTTEINGLRGSVLSTGPDSILVNINSTGFTAYTSGGQVNTRPQEGEQLMAGCLFDIPVRFETDLSGVTFANLNVLTSAINLVELLNPDEGTSS